MNGFFRLVCVCLMVVSWQVVGAQAPSQPPTNLNTLVTDWMDKAKIPGLAMARIEAGKVAWIRVYGNAAPNRKVTPETPFNVASLTKPVFAMVVLQQVAQSQFSLDGALAEHWVDPDVADDPRVRALTARLALSHQTGFPNWRGRDPLSFRFAPGKGTDYSGEGYEYLRRALEAATGKTLRELALPLKDAAGLSSAAFGWRADLKGRVAVGYDATGEPMDMDYLTHRGPAAASSLFSSVSDYANFTAWVSRGAGLPKPLFSQMQRDQAMHDQAVDHFGLGWRIVALDDATVLAHDGREDGVRTQVYVVPADQSGFVFLTNSSNGELLTRPLTTAVMPRGKAILAAMDANAWQFAASMPAQVQPRMLAFIARSPAFVSKLLHAADVSLIQPHFPKPELRQRVTKAIDRIALGLLNGELTDQPILAFFQTMGEAEGDGFRLTSHVSQDAAAQWLVGLEALARMGAD